MDINIKTKFEEDELAFFITNIEGCKILIPVKVNFMIKIEPEINCYGVQTYHILWEATHSINKTKKYKVYDHELIKISDVEQLILDWDK